MSNITNLPLIDGFETTLSQEWDGSTGTINVNETPGFTFPAGVKTSIVVNADNSKIQLAEISAYDAGAKTMTVSNITLEKGAGVNYSAQTHSIGSKVRISNNYEFWKAVTTAISSKLDSDADRTWSAGVDYAGMAGKPLTETQRDALTPVNGMIILNSTSGVLNQYISGAWTSFATGTTANASTTVAGKVELATDAQITAGTATGETGAELVSTPVQSKKSISLKNSVSTTSDTDEFVVNQSAEDKRVTQAILRDQLAASTTKKGTSERSTDAEYYTASDEERYITPYLGAYELFAADTLTLASAPTTRNTTSTTYVVQKEFTADRSGTLRISYNFGMNGGGGGNAAYSRVFIDGVAAGTEHIKSEDGSVSVVEDLAVVRGDSIEIKVKSIVGTNNAYISSALVRCGMAPVNAATLVTD